MLAVAEFGAFTGLDDRIGKRNLELQPVWEQSVT